MTSVNDIKDDPRFTPCLDHGFVGLIDHMGSDEDIARAARLSYGAGTKTINEDRGLIRYLIRLRHTSPIEMAEIKLHLKVPIFIMRQLVRHRTHNMNEYSGRYSIMSDEFYVPDLDQIKPQSTANKQGRGGLMSNDIKSNIQNAIRTSQEQSYDLYKELVEPSSEQMESIGDQPGEIIEFPGLTRELARTVLPVSNYTELYWKQDLHNLLHLIKLRRDNHAQYEIRVYAEAIYQAIKPLFPITCEAWEDYVWEAVTLSRMEVNLMKRLVSSWRAGNNPTDMVQFAHDELGMSKREVKEFATTWGLESD